MRISDWSSDVCSSDLVAAELGRHRAVLEVFGVEQIIDVGIERDIASLDAQPRVDRRKGVPLRISEVGDPEIGGPVIVLHRTEPGRAGDAAINASEQRQPVAAGKLELTREIGRASCREREWQNG